MDAGRRTSAGFLLIGLLLVLVGCGGDSGGGGGDGGDLTPAAATTSYPLQETGLAVGGDVQTRATDRISVGLTEEQVRTIQDACEETVEIASQGDDCLEQAVRLLLREILPSGSLPSGPFSSCGPPRPFCLKVHEFSVADQQVLGARGYLEVVEEEPAGPLCGSDPGGVCLRLGARTAEVFEQVVDPETGTSSSPATDTSSTATSETTTDSSTSTTGSSSESTGSSGSSAATSEPAVTTPPPTGDEGGTPTTTPAATP